MKPTRVLIAGISTRAAAESAARAGLAVTAIDAFADTDQHPAVRATSLAETFAADGAAEAVRDVDCVAVSYLSPFENHPEAVRTLGAGRLLWGNAPEVLTRVRDPVLLANTLRDRGFAVPAVRLKAEATTADVASGFRRPDIADDWLLKPLASGGGHRIRRWRQGDPVPRGCYLQEFVDGVPGSVVFAAAGRRAVPLGVFRQLIGDAAFGASGFRYCGNILAAAGEAHDDAIHEPACELARAVADAFDLVGVNGIDFIARDRVPYTIEVNPRWCASMELVERAYGIPVFGVHVAACTAGTLPDFDAVHAQHEARGAFGKAIVFAREDALAGETCQWLGGSGIGRQSPVRDIPRPGTRLRTGRPVCTVFAEASDAAACHALLVERAARVFADLRMC